MESHYPGVLKRTAVARLLALLAAVLGAAALGIVLWLQFRGHMAPCSLCIYQRLADLAVMVLAVAGLFSPAGLRALFWLPATLAAATGAGLAGWQWHLAQGATAEVCTAAQLMPPEAFAPGSLAGSIAMALTGYGSCAIAGQHHWLGVPLVAWSLGFFLVCALLLGTALGLVRRAHKAS